MVTIAAPSDALFKALADPVRREILTVLAARPQSVQPLADRFDISRPAVSRHLRVLKEAGLIQGAAEGRQNIYRLEMDPLRDIETWLRSLWRERLRSLKTHIEESAP